MAALLCLEAINKDLNEATYDFAVSSGRLSDMLM
jgi:hypothetical protein